MVFLTREFLEKFNFGMLNDGDSLRYYVVIPFVLGIISVGYYYVGGFAARVVNNFRF